jgi:CBS domain containing-hemolysin-like protein
MIPRIEILALDIGETLSAAKNLFIETGYTKIIVYKNSLDEILGYVHAFDMFKKPKSLRSIILPVEFIPESMMINDILNVLTKKKKSLAVVLDEYGGTSGLLTVEDIVEELFGEIEDEYDTLELKEVMINENEYKFSARLEVDYLNETYSLKLPEDEAYETLGGLVVYHSENIPTEKEVILIGNYEFIILTASSTKIDEIYLKISENKESS